MANTYIQRARENILPLSLAGNVKGAFKEWSFTENIHDHEIAEAECELCNQENLRYHFEIQNEYNGNILWVGSSCILKFGVSVYENEILLSEKDAKKKLADLTRKMQLESCIKSLEKLAKKENNKISNSALEYYKKEKKLTPRQAAVVFWRMNENNIDYQPSFFKIALRRDKHKYDLKQLQTFQVHTLWKALTPSQRKVAQAMGHHPPR